MNLIPKNIFDDLVSEYKGNYRFRTFSCRDQFFCLAFAQLTFRESLRDIEVANDSVCGVCLQSNSEKLYHIGTCLINEALSVYAKDDLIYKELDNTLFKLIYKTNSEGDVK